ncbi:GGDEF domain-containing protein [Aeromonas media]|jgi:diguanylate cyclase (GGDEF)-like protein|uniref:diguanylate cyclase n=3 Tax=Aeromonas media TaxID=651 RepID=A0AAP6GBJ1_AERME|nr:GGDEF domain-containing protein [Aeromonas media]MDX7899296.1 membrane-associated sensor domain-containing protein [Aeromonas media]MDX7922307.1 membrane-associated sensor domain-containing protein [Aeromonas media]TNI63260.1 GGDEF domain-containing protein [Aeromonas media]
MASAEQRRPSSEFDHHLYDARRRALSAGLRWFWAINQLAILFLLARFYIYQDARLVAIEGLPWRYECQLALVLVASVLPPLGWRWFSRQGTPRWQPWLWGCAMLWGLAWAMTAYAIATIELRGGFSLAFNIVSLLLLTALIAFYSEWRVFYCLSAPPLLFLLFEERWVILPSGTVHWLAAMCLLIVLETGRRMLNGWFELAVSREYDNLMLARKMDAMAHRDPLTGLANRRHFDQVCKQAIAQGTTLETPLTVILLDVDFFKRYNDHYGHQAGDECLILVAECLEESVREPGDLVARYGGEEFVVLLQETTLAGGQEVAERIRATLAARALPHEGSDVAPHLTLSQGIAQWRPGESLVMLLERVDGALYEAKGAGRNGYRLAS